jgi:DNA mismatch endonuclease (patch repair protein)
MDRLTKAQRSRLMSRITGDDLKPETAVRAMLEAAGFVVYRHVRFHALPGSPDAIVADRRMAVFVDGCFWHKCPTHYRAPKTRRAAWARKIDGNVRRDRRVRAALRKIGWRAYTVRECNLEGGVARIVAAMKRIGPDKIWHRRIKP